MKLIAVVLFALLSVANAEVSVRTSDVTDHTDVYIRLNGLHYEHVLEVFNEKLQEFEDIYNGLLKIVTINREMLIQNIVEFYASFRSMGILNELSKNCVATYSQNIPTVEVTKNAITKCHQDYSLQLSTLLKEALITRDAFSENIAKYYDNVQNCGTEFGVSTANYTLCVTDVTALSNDWAIRTERKFQAHLEAAECTAKANVKSAVDCNYSVEYRTHTLIAESALQIENCLWPDDECSNVCEDYTCNEIYHFKGNFTKENVVNPFFGRSDSPQCIMFNVV